MSKRTSKHKTIVMTDFVRFILFALQNDAKTILVVTRDIPKRNEEALILLDFLGADRPAFRLNGRCQGLARDVPTRVKMILPSSSEHIFRLGPKSGGSWAWVDGGDEAVARMTQKCLSRSGEIELAVVRHWPPNDKAFLTITPPHLNFVPQP